MIKKKECLVCFFLVSCIFLSISFVSADNMTDIDDSNNEHTDDSIVDNSRSKSFTDLNNLINDFNNSEIILEDDYVYQDKFDENFTRGIFINKQMVINGNNHIIDAQNKSGIFNIKADNVIIKNIIFMNANGQNSISYFPMHLDGHDGYNGVVYYSNNFHDTYYEVMHSLSVKGGAIYCGGVNLKIINSSFVNNFASRGGGIYIEGDNAQLINLLFINNTSEEGGAIFNSGKNTFVLNSQFNLNHAFYGGDSICSYKDINIQNCIFTNDTKSVVLCGGNWQIDNITSSYFDSFVKFGRINFKFNLTHIQNDYYNLKIKFGYRPSWWSSEDYITDDKLYGFSVNRKFCLNIDGVVYNLQTDSNSQASLYLNLSNGNHDIEVFNPISKCSLSKSFNVSRFNELNNLYDANATIINKIHKVSPKVIAINKVFNKKIKIKKYTITLKNKGKAIKPAWFTLKINGKIFKAKTNNKGKATFKITKLNKKGTYNAILVYKGNSQYNKVIKKVKIKIK